MRKLNRAARGHLLHLLTPESVEARRLAEELSAPSPVTVDPAGIGLTIRAPSDQRPNQRAWRRRSRARTRLPLFRVGSPPVDPQGRATARPFDPERPGKVERLLRQWRAAEASVQQGGRRPAFV